MEFWYIFLSFIFYSIEIGMFIYLCIKVRHHHSLTLKDTAIYPLVVLLTMIVLFVAQFHYENAKTTSDAVGVIHDGVGIVTLAINSNLVKTLWTHGDVSAKFIAISYIGSYTISALALFSLSLSLLKVAIFNFGRSFKALLSLKERNYVFGFNEETKEFLKNLNKYERRKTILVLNNSIIDKYVDEKLFLDKYKIKFILLPYSNNKEMYESIRRVTHKKFFSRIKGFFTLSLFSNVYIISFLNSDKENYDFVLAAQKFLTYNVVLKNIYKEKKYEANKKLKEKKYGANKELKKKKYEANKELKKKNSFIFKYHFIIYTNTIQTDFLLKLSCDNYYHFSEKEVAKIKYKKEFESKMKDAKDKSFGLIRVFNKYELISLDFIKRYSFAKYLNVKDEEGKVICNYINDNCTIKDGCDINLIFLGFGNVNQVLLRDLLTNNQFAEIKDGKLSSKRIKVKIYEKEKKLNSLQLSNGLLKYKMINYVDETCNLDNSKNYFGLIDDYISDIDMTKFDTVIGDKDFMNDLYDFIHDDSNRMKFNFFIISIGTDFENCTLANTIAKDLKEINKDKAKNVFFARTKETYNMNNGINAFGRYSNILSYSNVIKDEINEIALENHYLYSNGIYTEKISEEDKAKTRISVSELSHLKRLSNVYSVYSLYHKVALLNAMNQKEYIEKYSIPNYKKNYLKITLKSFKNKKNNPIISNNGKNVIYEEKIIGDDIVIIIPISKIKGKEEDDIPIKELILNSSVYLLFESIINSNDIKAVLFEDENDKEPTILGFDFDSEVFGDDNVKYIIGFNLTNPVNNLSCANVKFTARDVLAFIEHERWNAFELSNGVLPRKISNCFDENYCFTSKSPDEMYHANITTQKGLYDTYKMVLEKGLGKNKKGEVKKINVLSSADVICYDYDLMDYLYKSFDSINTRLMIIEDDKNV